MCNLSVLNRNTLLKIDKQCHVDIFDHTCTSICLVRVKYREEQIQKKLEERKFIEAEKDLEEREKEYRLERLREKVKCNILKEVCGICHSGHSLSQKFNCDSVL